MTPTQRVLVWFAAIIVGCIVVIIIADTIRGTLDPGLALAALAPVAGGLFAAIVVKADSDNRKDKP
jgi:hypothetical protein